MNTYLTHLPVDILLVEGNVAVVDQLRRAMRKGKFKNRVHCVGNAVEASSYLRREGPYMHAPIPGLVLLDANLPQRSVIDLIRELKTDAQIAEIPVIAIVGSESERQLVENCPYTVDGSIEKPFDLPELIQALMPVDTLSYQLVRSIPGALRNG